MAAPVDSAPPAPARVLVSGGLVLAAGSVVSNLLGLGLTVVLARSFDHERYGAVAALLSLSLVMTVPASGLQYVVARRAAATGLRGEHDRGAWRAAFWLGTLLAGLVVLLAPAIGPFLHVPVLAVVFVGITLLPYTINCAQSGSLLGQALYARFAASQILLAASQIIAALLAGRVGSVTGVTAFLAAATAVAALGCLWLTGVGRWRVAAPTGGPFLRELVQATVALAGLSIVMNLDVVLARHYLSPKESGIYALGALFAKAALWGAQFIPQLLFPKIAAASGDRPLLLAGAGIVVGIGGCVVLAAGALATPVLRLASGDADPAASAHLAVRFGLLGVGWALCHLLLLCAVAARNPWPVRVLWPALAIEVALICLRFHRSPSQIVTTCVVATLVLVALIALTTIRPPARALVAR